MQSLTAADEHLLAFGRALLAQGYGFTTVTPATHARVNGRSGNAWARTVQQALGWSRPFAPDLLPPALLAHLQAAGELLPHDGGGYRSALRVSSIGGRLYLHSAYPTQAADAVFFGPDTYRFVDAVAGHLAQRAAPVRRAVDIGCGAGPGAIELALRAPAAEVLAVDINPRALRLTRLNAALAGAANVEACHSDLLTALQGDFDLIVANPPYLLDPAERTYRHGGGSFGEGLSLAIARSAAARLAPGGSLVLYTGSTIVDGHDAYRHQLSRVLDNAGLAWHYREVDPDVFGEELLEPAYAGADRIAAVVAVATRQG